MFESVMHLLANMDQRNDDHVGAVYKMFSNTIIKIMSLFFI